MAWGELRYDHSDIFHPERHRTAADPVGLTRAVVNQKQRIVEYVRQRGRDGASTREVALMLGHANPKGRPSMLLRELVSDGLLIRLQLKPDHRGNRPYTYFTP